MHSKPIEWDFGGPHLFPVTVAATDIDGLNHANNAVYVQWCEQAAWSHSEALGLTLEDYKRLDRAVAIRRSEFDYVAAAFEGERLILGTWITQNDGKLSMERRFQLVRERDGATLMRGRWALVCIEISSGRPRRLPREFLQHYGITVL